MHSVVYAMTPCQCVRLSVTFVYSCMCPGKMHQRGEYPDLVETSVCLVAQEQRGELELVAFVLHNVNETTLRNALKLTSDDVTELRALLRDDHQGICLIIRLLEQNNRARRRTIRRQRTTRWCRSVDTVLRNRISVKMVVAEMLNDLHVVLSNPQL